ncbi:hypothetical protein SDRG_03929 [Saprolegnia diclina VS20]|uniref:PH domain-containing protein n=1 Tax=Saprolegnia diclina (strain VS20) TaxID=1156394 RepID=T0QY74_SAPDV|nr:hypothetical protein SDRG_03929 [Saprolegnia diclina VS20]EQC38975.1 hypothetical protein SDRG_03929 [Saprolegnia diclina VS20]|eukprot:XP_008607799.1 hypothetical protein SDRG_03929 [Saprolegnia diclina VS20]
MKVLAEGDLRKRCATLPMMRRRYCMLLLDDSNSAKLKVLLRSYKSKAERDGSADSFVSSHVVKCIGEWTGKGNLHTYPHAFVVETAQSKLFHCSAPSSEAKASWMHAIPFAEDGLYALVGPGVTPILSASSQDDVPTPNDAPMPASFHESTTNVRESTANVRASQAARPPPPSRESSTRPESSNLERPVKARPPSVKDALFQRKAKQTTKRDLVADLEIESDEEGAAPESVLLEPSLLGPKIDPYEVDVHIGYVPPAPMKLQFEVDPQATAMTSVAPSNDSDEDEIVPMDPDLYARISQLRMDEAKEATRRPKDEARLRRNEAEPRVARKVKAKKHKKRGADESSRDPHHHHHSSSSTSQPTLTSKRDKSRREASPSPPAPRRAPPLPADDAPQPHAVRPAPLPKGPALALPDIEGF